MKSEKPFQLGMLSGKEEPYSPKNLKSPALFSLLLLFLFHRAGETDED